MQSIALEVIIVVSDIEEEAINKMLNELKLDINHTLVSIPYSRDFGTADSLRLIKDKIKVCFGCFTSFKFSSNYLYCRTIS